MYNAEFVQFGTPDGLNLPGLLFAAKDSKKAVIYLHGNGSSSVFYSGNYDMAKVLNEHGITVLMFNNRGAHIIKNIDKVSGNTVENGKYGMAYEKIKECVEDIDGAVLFLKSRGYNEFHLMGSSTGANKICVYDHYKPDNEINKYILLAGGDDTGIFFDMIGKEKTEKLLAKAQEKIAAGKGTEIIEELLDMEIFSWQGFYDIANPDGDYNCFPYSEVIKNIKLSRKPLFRYFQGIQKPSLVMYGELDEYAWGDIPRVVEILKKYQPSFEYHIIPGADHGFTGKKAEMAELAANFIVNT
jgi:pimeloyl-ACP methyl ester carboxylesterase